MTHKLRKLIIGAVAAGLVILGGISIATAQMGGGISVASLWYSVGNALLPTNPNATIGSATQRIAGIYATTVDAATLTIGGAATGTITGSNFVGTQNILSTFAGPLSVTSSLNIFDGSLLVNTTSSPDVSVLTPFTTADTFFVLSTDANKYYDFFGNSGLATLLTSPQLFFTSDAKAQNEWAYMGMANSGTRAFNIGTTQGDGFAGGTYNANGIDISVQSGSGGTLGGDGGDIQLYTNKANFSGNNGGDLVIDFGNGKDSGREGWLKMKNANEDLRIALNGSNATMKIFANGSTTTWMSLQQDATNSIFDASTGTFKFMDPVEFTGAVTFDTGLSLSVPLAVGDIASTVVNTKNGYTYRSNFDLSEEITDFSSATNWTGLSSYFEVNSTVSVGSGLIAGADIGFFITSTNGWNYNNMAGMSIEAIHNGSGNVAWLTGNNIYASNYGAGSVTQQNGLYIDSVNYGTGNVKNNLALQINSGSYGTGTSTYDAALYISQPYTNGNNLSKHYGIVLEDQRGATSSESYAFKYPETSTAGISPFVVYASGTVGIGTSAPSSTLHIVGDSIFNGAMSYKVEVGTDKNFAGSEHFYGVTSTGAAVDITLADAASNNGKVVIVKDVSCTAMASNIRVDGAGTDLIDGGAGQVLINQKGGSKTFISADNKWWTIAETATSTNCP